jgi:ABC-2 type transport system ATP-binding protein
MIKVTNLTKHYGNITAIDNLSFEIKKGEIIGFLGPNGAGKTTTMKILTCYMPPSHGDAYIKNLSIQDDSYEIRKLIGYLPENNPLYFDMTVFDYLNFIAQIRKIPRSQKKQKINRVTELCQIGPVLNQPIEELSKGFKQRVGLAQALLHKPELLILDEPTIGLDPNQMIEIRHLIKELGKEATIIMCSHILPEVSATCSRVFILKKGQIIADGRPKDLTNRAKGEKIIYFEVNQNENTVQKNLQKIIPNLNIRQIENNNPFIKYKIKSNQDIREKLFQLTTQNNWVLRELTMEDLSLEDVFIDLTKET